MVAYAKPSRFHANLELLRVSEFGGRSQEPLCTRLYAKLKLNLAFHVKKKAKHP